MPKAQGLHTWDSVAPSLDTSWQCPTEPKPKTVP